MAEVQKPAPRHTLPLWRLILSTHRWSGIALGGLVFVWFASGIVMMYARLPALDPADRLARLSPIDPEPLAVAPAALQRANFAAERVRVGMLLDRPVYRFLERGRWHAMFADDGSYVVGIEPDVALSIAAQYLPERASTMRMIEHRSEPDQWTLQLLPLLPMYRVAAGDAEGTELYVAERTGEVVLETTASSRFWGFAGAVSHWLYFTRLRKNGSLWFQLVKWLSIATIILTLTGLVWGLRRYLRNRGSPYSGWLRWHHWAGLVFGLTSLTWIVSGLLSIEPWSFYPSTSPSAQEKEAAAGAFRLSEVELAHLRAGLETLETLPAKEAEIFFLRGEPYLIAYRALQGRSDPEGATVTPPRFLSAAQPYDHRLIALGEVVESRGEFAQSILIEAAADAIPGEPVAGATLLDRYDNYYYDRFGSLPLPVLRVDFDNSGKTALYLDPRSGVLLRREEGASRINRWLYRGLHSWDFPFLESSLPLREVLMLLFLLGGAASSLSALVPALRRLRSKVGRPPPADVR